MSECQCGFYYASNQRCAWGKHGVNEINIKRDDCKPGVFGHSFCQQEARRVEEERRFNDIAEWMDTPASEEAVAARRDEREYVCQESESTRRGCPNLRGFDKCLTPSTKCEVGCIPDQRQDEGEEKELIPGHCSGLHAATNLCLRRDGSMCKRGRRNICFSRRIWADRRVNEQPVASGWIGLSNEDRLRYHSLDRRSSRGRRGND